MKKEKVVLQKVKTFLKATEEAINEKRGRERIKILQKYLYLTSLGFKMLRDNLSYKIPSEIGTIIEEMENEYGDSILKEGFEEEFESIRKRVKLIPLGFSVGGVIGALGCYELTLFLNLPNSLPLALASWISSSALGAVSAYAWYRAKMNRYERKLVRWGERLVRYGNQFFEELKG